MTGSIERRRIGSLEVSLVGLGCNNFGMRMDQERTTAVVDAAIEAGINFFDTADVYGGTKSEEFLGVALRGRRDDVVIATKFGAPVGSDPTHRGASARWITSAVEDSLRRLGTDRIDLYQQHMPDNDTPLSETLEALDGLVRAGKVREIGNSNYSGSMIGEAAALSSKNGWASFVSAQNEFSLLRRGAMHDVIPACQAHGLGLLPYFPLASGLLTGKYERGVAPASGTRLAGFPAERVAGLMSDKNFDRVEALTAWASERGHTILELAFAWLAAQPAMASIIAGATSPAQVQANVAAVAWKLSAADLESIEGVLHGDR